MIFESFIHGNGRNPVMKELMEVGRKSGLKDSIASRRCPPCCRSARQGGQTAFGEGSLFLEIYFSLHLIP